METSDNNATLEKVDLTSSEVAFAIKKIEGTPQLGIYIPTLMSEIEMGETTWEKTEGLNSSMLLNKDKNFNFESITLCNYYMVEPYDPAQYYVDTELGEQVRIKFLDNDIKKCYYYDDTYKMTDFLTEETIRLEERIDSLQETVITLTQSLATANSQIASLQGENSSLRSQISSLRGEVNSLRGMIK